MSDTAPQITDVSEARSTRATVLFADITGFTELSEQVGPERAYLAVTGILRILDGIARRHGGSVDKYLGDCLMVVFGHPVPLPDAAHAAASAALAMRERVRAYSTALAVPLELVIGINTGTMVAGGVGGRVIREFHVLGDAVNVAARLKAKAPRGAIYVGPETRRETADAFAYGEFGQIRLKGKSAPVPIFELVRSLERRSGSGLGARLAAPAPSIGRAHERAALEQHLERLAAGEGGAVLITGAEGSGKSHLLAELAGAPVGKKVAAVHAWAGPETLRTPVLLADLLEAFESDDAHSAEQALRAGTVRGGEAAALAADTLGEHAAALPLAVVLEDLHAADEASLALLPEVVARARVRGVLFLLTSRSDGDGEAAARLAEACGAERLRLEPLSDAESRALVAATAVEAIPEASMPLLLERSAGLPGRLVLGTFLAPALRAELEDRQHGARGSDAERRRATILFADITGFTAMTERMGAERAYPVVVGCLQLMDEIARKHGGSVEKYLGDCVMALFGVPEAIEDAPRAAVNAAIEMRRRVRDYSAAVGPDVALDVHSGIHTGLGIAGDISGPMIREFAVMGDPVSVADALKDLAPPGQVYVGEAVHRDTRDVFEYRELPASRLEGRARSLRAFELLSQREHLHRARIGSERRLFSSLVGRDRELAQLRGLLAALRAGRGGIASVIAEAGLGKSRLVAELAASEEAREVAWLEGRSISTGRQLSFHPIADLCRSWAGMDDEDDEASARAKLEAAIRRSLPDEVDEVLPFFAAILGLRPDAAGEARLAGLQGDAMEKLIRGSVTRLLRAASRNRPLVVVMDDLHWADGSSIELLESVLRLCESHPILFVHLFRPGYPATERMRERARTEHEGRHLELELRPIDAAATRSLLSNLFRQGDIPHATRQMIEEKARGNPFYVEEVVRSLVDAGAVEAVGGRFRATEKIHAVVVPGTIQEVVMARVDGLPLRERQLLQTACVIGGVFHGELLAAVVSNEGGSTAPGAPGHEDDFEAALQHLIEAEFLVPSDRLPGQEYAFKHPLLQEVAYEGLLLARREELHRRIGEAIERVLPADVPGYAGMLAYHYGQGGDVERAEAFLFRAGDEAARAAASSEALAFFEEASKLYLQRHGEGGDPQKRALLEKNVARALSYRGRFIEAIEHFDRAVQFLGDRVVEGGLRSGLLLGWNLAAVLGRLYVPAWRRRPAATPRQREIFELRYARAEATVMALPTRHLFDSMDGLALLQRIDPTSVPRSGMFYAGAAALFAFGGISFDVSRRLGARARALVRASDPDEDLYERAMRFTARVLEGDWADEHEIEVERLDESVRRGQLWGPTTYLGLLGEKHLHRGRYDEARACLGRIDGIWDVFHYDLAKTNHYYLLTLLALERHELPAAIAAADSYYDEIPEDLLHILALGAKARAQTLLGALDFAEETLRHAGELVASSAPVPPFHASAYHRARLGLDVARLAEARDASRTTLRRARRRARRSARAALRSAARVAWRRPEVLRLAGRGRALRGDARGALRLLERSVAEGERLGARPETARSYAEVGRLLRTRDLALRFRDLDADACTERARVAFQDLGLGWDLGRLDHDEPL